MPLRCDIFGGEVIATSLDPEFAAARALRDRGLSGELRFFRPGNPVPALVMRDLVRAADDCTTEGRFKKHQPFDRRMIKDEPNVHFAGN
jgi:hypothetical protein